MSRAFVKDDADNERIIVPQRAPLPRGVDNLVTPNGLAMLRRERADLVEQRLRLQADADDAPERARRLTVVREQLDDLDSRLASARVVEPPAEATTTVALGARVMVRHSGGEELHFRIVGVDEADPLEGLVAFTAPMAVAVLGRAVGDTVTFDGGRSEQVLDIVAVGYGADGAA